MMLFGVRLRMPPPGDLLLVPLCGAGGMLLGALIQRQTAGALAPVYGMGAAAFVASLLALSGADTDAGWRGVVLTAGSAILAFFLATTAVGLS